MGFAFPKLRIGSPASCAGLTVFPLFPKNGDGAEYLLASKAMAAGLVVVEEVGTGGSVPDLMVRNESDRRVLFLEGDELVGAKQNRVINATLVVPAESRVKIPVSCVEQGRWRHVSRSFRSSGHSSPHRLRHVLRSSVTRSLRSGRAYRSDQGEVWDEVSRQQESLETESPTRAMADTFEAHRSHLTECRGNLRYTEGASGFAIGIGDRIASIDLFDKPETCREVWDRILSGAMLSGMELEEEASLPDVADVKRTIEETAELTWETFEAAGEGSQFRAESESGSHGAALVLEGVVVHGSLVTQC